MEINPLVEGYHGEVTENIQIMLVGKTLILNE